MKTVLASLVSKPPIFGLRFRAPNYSAHGPMGWLKGKPLSFPIKYKFVLLTFASRLERIGKRTTRPISLQPGYWAYVGGKSSYNPCIYVCICHIYVVFFLELQFPLFLCRLLFAVSAHSFQVHIVSNFGRKQLPSMARLINGSDVFRVG